jgi:hypothetical protein
MWLIQQWLAFGDRYPEAADRLEFPVGTIVATLLGAYLAAKPLPSKSDESDVDK